MLAPFAFKFSYGNIVVGFLKSSALMRCETIRKKHFLGDPELNKGNTLVTVSECDANHGKVFDKSLEMISFY